jgi:hypothetical protein
MHACTTGRWPLAGELRIVSVLIDGHDTHVTRNTVFIFGCDHVHNRNNNNNSYKYNNNAL